MRLHAPHLHDPGPVREMVWRVIGALVLLYIFVAALGALEPGEAQEVTALMVVLAVAWTAHNWWRLWKDEHAGGGPA